MQSKKFSREATLFEGRLDDIDIREISPVPYCQNYLSYLLDHKKYFLEIYADVFDKVLTHAEKKKEEITLVDYGAGNGLLGIFAKYCGFGRVYINDVDEKFIGAAEKLASQLSIDIDGFITGDSASLLSHFEISRPDAIVGTDVIEHIYDLNTFFSVLKKLNPAMITVFTTASNPDNYIKTKVIKKLQLKDELQGGEPSDSVLFGSDPHKPYLKIREDIIREYFLLSEDRISQLALATRGLKKEDILSLVERVMTTGKNTYQLPRGNNTCHPITGSWTERILTINEYAEVYNNAGFKLNLYKGLYDVHKTLGKNIINRLLNFGVMILGKTFAPYIVLTGTKK